MELLCASRHYVPFRRQQTTMWLYSGGIFGKEEEIVLFQEQLSNFSGKKFLECRTNLDRVVKHTRCRSLQQKQKGEL